MTEEQKNVVIKRRSSGFGYASIAKEIGLTKDAVVAFCRRNGLTGNMAGKVPEETGSRCKECGAVLVQAEGMKTRVFLLCAVPEEMVEGTPGDAEQKSGLHPYLRRVRQGVHGLRQFQKEILLPCLLYQGPVWRRRGR